MPTCSCADYSVDFFIIKWFELILSGILIVAFRIIGVRFENLFHFSIFFFKFWSSFVSLLCLLFGIFYSMTSYDIFYPVPDVTVVGKFLSAFHDPNWYHFCKVINVLIILQYGGVHLPEPRTLSLFVHVPKFYINSRMVSSDGGDYICGFDPVM